MKENFNDFSLLLGEDDRADALIMTRVLEQMNFQGSFTHLTKGQDIIDWVLKINQYEGAKHHLPQLIILDIGLPGLNGVEILRTLRQHEQSKTIPILMCSGSCSQRDLHQCIALGSNGYIQKTEDMDVFSKTCRLFIEAWYGVTQQTFF
jgi:two-component system response regulator